MEVMRCVKAAGGEGIERGDYVFKDGDVYTPYWRYLNEETGERKPFLSITSPDPDKYEFIYVPVAQPEIAFGGILDMANEEKQASPMKERFNIVVKATLSVFAFLFWPTCLVCAIILFPITIVVYIVTGINIPMYCLDKVDTNDLL